MTIPDENSNCLGIPVKVTASKSLIRHVEEGEVPFSLQIANNHPCHKKYGLAVENSKVYSCPEQLNPLLKSPTTDNAVIYHK